MTLAERIIRDLDNGLTYADMAQKHQVPIEEIGGIVDVIKLARNGMSDVERAAKAMVISQRILRDNGVVVIATPEQLRNFGVKVGIWSLIGAVSMVGFAYWWEANEDERKETRAWKKREKVRKEAQRVAEKQAAKVATTSVTDDA